MNQKKLLKLVKNPAFIIPIIIILITIFILKFIFFNFSKNLNTPTIKNSSNNSLFIAKNSAFKVEFGDKKTDQPLVKYSTSKNNSISFIFSNFQKTNPINNKKSIIFPEVKPNIDLRYTTLSNGIKEEIIIKKQISNNIFNFDLQTNNAYPNQETNNLYTGTFRDKNGNYLFHFEKPFAIDSQGNRTDNVSFQIKKSNSDNNYQLILNVDQKWLQSPDRVYPITVDPTIVTDTITEFSSGEFNRTRDIGTTESSPIIESSYQEAKVDQYTVSLWHLDETGVGTGTTLYDSSASNNGITTGTTVVNGISNKARSLLSATDAITIPNSSSWNTPPTIEFWAKRSSTQSTVQNIICHNNSSTAGWCIDFEASNVLSFVSQNIGIIASNRAITDTDWHHYAITWNGTSHTFYIDGVASGTSTVNNPTTTSNNLVLGADSDGTSHHFYGSLDEIKISNTVRSAEEIAENASRRTSSTYTSSVLDLTKVFSWNDFSWSANGLATGDGETPFSTTGLVAQWNFNESSGTTAVSTGTCGASCNGTLINFANTSSQDVGVTSGWTYNNRRWGNGAIIFDGTNDYINTGNVNLANSSFTISSWAKRSSIGVAHMIMSIGSSSTTNYNLHFGFRSTNIFTCAFYGNDLNTPIAYTDTDWHYWTCTFDASSKARKIYRDGVLVASDTASSNFLGSENLHIGRYNDGTIQSYFNGIIDTPQVYSRTLANSEIISNYNSSRLEFQTRVGNSSNPNDGTWESWKPTTNETQIDSMDTTSTNWAWDNTTTYMPKTKSDDNIIKVEGSGSLKLTTGIGQTDTNTKGLWHLDETSGTGAYITDSSGNVASGSPTGTTSVDGIASKARSFNGSSEGIGFSGTPTTNTTNFSMEAWINPSSIGQSGIAVYNGNDSGGYGFGLGSGAGGSGSKLTVLMGNVAWIDCGYTFPSANQWYHVAITRDTTTLRCYVNGAQTANTSTSTPLAVASKFSIGMEHSSSNVAYRFFAGKVDEVKVSNITRTAEEIAENYRMGNGHRLTKTISPTDLSSKTKLPFYIASDRLGTFSQLTIGNTAFSNYEPNSNSVGFWHLDEQSGSGAYIKDSSGNSNHGTPTGTTSVKGKIVNARSFNGSSDYINTGSSINLANSSFTISTWAKRSTIGASHMILSKGSTDTTDDVLHFGFRATNAFTCAFYGNDLDTPTTYTDTDWHYWTCTFDASSKARKIYRDGVLVASGTASSNYLGSGNLYIGVYKAGSTSSYFSGFLDEIQINNIVQPIEEIRQAYEIGARTHKITIDFKASLTSDLITDSNDTDFVVNETVYGSSFMANHIFTGDKIIVKENYNGTEYIAQGTVTSVNSSTGAISVASWDTGSTFPINGFTTNATVFKWQQEFFDITNPLSSQKNSITYLTYQITDGSSAANIWLDDLKSSSGYLSNSSGSTITSSTSNRYFQYRAIFSQNNSLAPSTQLTNVTLDYTQNTSPNIPILNSPTNTAINQTFLPTFSTTATDNNNDYLQYKIELCTNSLMTLGCQTFDQTNSQTGWSGQNTQSNTAYTSGTQASYTLQSNLSANTTYYWRSYAIDPAGINTWSSTQTSPYSFTTLSAPNPATVCIVNSISPNSYNITWTDNSNNEDGFMIQRSTNSGTWTDLQNYSSNTTSHLDNTVSLGSTYRYRIAPYFTGPIYSDWCYTSIINLGQGDFNFEGLNLEGINID